MERAAERLERGWEYMAVVNAATAALVDVIAAIVPGGAELDGFRSPEHFVAWRFGVSPRRARGLVAIARRRDELPATIAAFEAGLITEDQTAVIARLVPAEREAEVKDLAAVCTVTQLERICRSIPQPAAADAPRERAREVHRGYDDDTTWRLSATLPADEGALVDLALSAARDAVFHDRHPDAADGARPTDVTWADALVRMAERSLDAIDPASRAGRHPSERYSATVHIHLDNAGTPEVTRLHAGPVIPDALRRYLTCDATFRAVVEASGRALGITIPAPTVDNRLRRLVEERDGGCRVPGCTQTRWLHVHHIVHREDGGETAIGNLVCLCPYHHRLHHAGVIRIHGDPYGALTVTHRNGHTLTPSPPRPGTTEHILLAARRLGLHYGPYAGTACEPINDWGAINWN